MLEIVNALTCGVLMLLLYPVAVVMHHAGHWPERLALVSTSVLMGLQAVAPVFDWLPEANGLQVLFNVVLAFAVVMCRQEIMVIVRMTVGAPPEVLAARHPMRRESDMSEEMMGRVNGGKGEPS